ncbi:uncharacterized protein OCT59_001345 [Rhizophagus irregularis]|uniref:uncharacterized protein n=1 Tax=Rhizophagus irregularis TaxID=588596 RepID=UPI00332FAB66|nr:hypothetical protein OCT59_001345 [Rhizophagus irregularis]
MMFKTTNNSHMDTLKLYVSKDSRLLLRIQLLTRIQRLRVHRNSEVKNVGLSANWEFFLKKDGIIINFEEAAQKKVEEIKNKLKEEKRY